MSSTIDLNKAPTPGGDNNSPSQSQVTNILRNLRIANNWNDITTEFIYDSLNTSINFVSDNITAHESSTSAHQSSNIGYTATSGTPIINGQANVKGALEAIANKIDDLTTSDIKYSQIAPTVNFITNNSTTSEALEKLDLAINDLTTDDIADGSTNLFVNTATTDNLTEGATNLYSQFTTSNQYIRTEYNVGIGTNATVSLDIGNKTDAIRVPSGTTSERPTGNNSGYIRFNTDISAYESSIHVDGSTKWKSLGQQIFYGFKVTDGNLILDYSDSPTEEFNVENYETWTLIGEMNFEIKNNNLIITV